MFVKIMIIFAVTNSVRSIPKKSCNRIQINNTWYDREIILSDVGRAHNLNVHKSTNTLFFSYSVSDIYADVDFQLAFINLDTRENEIIAGIRGGCTVAIDQGNDVIYLGGSDGIYKYNMLTKLADNYKEKGINIWYLYFRSNLFYISYPDQKLYIEVDGKFIRVKEFEDFEVDNFYVLPNNEKIYFANKSGLYIFDSVTLSIDIVNDLVIVRQIVEDNDGVLYVCTNMGLLVFRDDEFRKALDLKGIYGLAFDKDNSFILSDEKHIIKLIPSNNGCENNENLNW